jgi:hypothetical protein
MALALEASVKHLCLVLLVALAACSSPGQIAIDGEKLDVDRTKVRERVPSAGWVQLELISEPDPDWAPPGTRDWVPKDRAAVRISLPHDVQVRDYTVGDECRIEVAPRASSIHDVLGAETAWVSATGGVVTIEEAGEDLVGNFWADTPAGPVEGTFDVKRRLIDRPDAHEAGPRNTGEAALRRSPSGTRP